MKNLRYAERRRQKKRLLAIGKRQEPKAGPEDKDEVYCHKINLN